MPLGETDNCLFNFGQRAHGNTLAHCVAQTTLMQWALTLHVEAELDDVAVLDDVFFAFDAELAGFAGFGLGAEGDEIVEGDGSSGDETALASSLSPKLAWI